MEHGCITAVLLSGLLDANIDETTVSVLTSERRNSTPPVATAKVTLHHVTRRDLRP
jgi:hypothetical protein